MSRLARLVTAILAFGTVAQAQVRPVGRVDIAILNPDSARTIHLAYDLGAGVDLGPHATVLADWTRRNLSGLIQGDGATWETLVGGAFEYALGSYQGMYERQVTLGLRGGAIRANGPIRAAPYLGFSLGFRYPVIANLRVDGDLEDVFAFPPRQSVAQCDIYGDCVQRTVGGGAHQNFGLSLGVEVHP